MRKSFMLILLALTCLIPDFSHAIPSQRKRIFMLQSYHQTHDIYLNEVKGYSPYLYINEYEIETEFLNSDLIAESENGCKELINLYNNVYDKHYDLIILMNQPAIDFVNKHFHELTFAHNSQILLCGLITDPKDLHINNSVVLPLHIDIKETLEQIIKFKQNISNLFIVNDYSSVGKEITKIFKDKISKMASLKNIQIAYNDSVSLKDLLDSIKKLPSNSVLLIGKYSQDKYNGSFYSSNELVKHIREVSSVPIFCISDTYIHPEVVGGKVIDNVVLGEIIGKSVHFLLDKQDFSLDSLYQHQTRWMFSYPELKARGFKSKTPSNTVYLFKPESFLKQNRNVFIVLLVVLLLGIVAIIIVLYFNYILRKQLNIKTILLQKQLNKYKQLVFTMPLGYIEFDSNVNPFRCNDVSMETLGYNTQEANLKAIKDILDCQLKDEKSQKVIQQLMNGEVTHSSFQNIKRSDGSLITCDIYAIPIYEDNNVTQFIALTVDITESLKLNTSLQILAETSKKLLMENNRYLSSSIHDLKNLMSPMVAYIEMLELIEKDEKAKSILEKMSNSTSNIIDSFTQMMTISRLKGDVYTYTEEELHPSVMVTNLLGMLEATYKQKGIEVSNEIPDEISVVGDKDMVNSIFLNLIGNSIKFTVSGDKIRISAPEYNDKFVSFSVENNGITADLERINLIFTEQKHFSTSGTDGEVGTGMGLLLCHDLVAKNGGTITVSHNDEGKGCRFTFTLPIK